MPSRTQAQTHGPTRASGSRAPGPDAETRPPAPRRTLWEEGTRPGTTLIRTAVLAMLAVTLVSLLFGNHIGILFDIAFVLVCLGSALLVRPQDFFAVGVLPPLLLGFVVLVLTVVDRGAVARSEDPAVQAVVSGLAHHSLALVIGYGLTLLVLALRQVALRNRGTLRPHRPAR